MAVLLHLNGPPGIGKSTLAALWAERHPRTLDLDVDTLHLLVGGWQDPANRTHEVLRPVAKAMASAYLATGRDVVLPQYLGRLDEVESFERVAHGQGADFREVVLLDDRDAALARFDARRDDTAWNQHNRRVVASLGGDAFLVDMYDRLLEVLRARPGAVVVRSEPDAVEATYAALERAVAE
jgi:predicted kinase